MVAALALVAVSLVALLLDGNRSWKVGVLGTALTIGTLSIVALYVVQLRRSMAGFRGMGTPEATLRVDADSISMESEIGQTTLRWSAVTEIWKFRDFWLLLLSKAQFVTLPLGSISPEMQEVISESIRATGGKVDG